MNNKVILGASVGNCVHVAGLYHFLKLTETEGYKTVFLGPAVPVERLFGEIEIHKPSIVALSYRLTPQNARNIFKEIQQKINDKNIKGIRFIFGGTKPAAEAAREFQFFDKAFTGEESEMEIKEYLRGKGSATGKTVYSNTLVERINEKHPYPLLRHHFGRPSVEETIEGVRKIAEAGVLDIISLGTDQNAQEHFFHPEEMIKALDGAGGVPVRKKEDLSAIYNASRCGNFPLMRCYSGTRELIKWAEMSVETINNAWVAVPLTWYSVMDGRSERSLKDTVAESRKIMKWYAERNIPVEVNESHQWSLRDAHDSLAVTMSFLAAYNAKKMGVKHYVSQYMFNTPPGTSPQMDIAKMLAKQELIKSIHDENFVSFNEVRGGIAHFSSDPLKAKGQLAASAVVSMALKPHILHVVGFSEGDHAIYPEELIESCKIIHGVMHNCLYGLPDLTLDENVQRRKNELMNEAKDLMNIIIESAPKGTEDPLTDPGVIADAIKNGILDTPHFRGNKHLYGRITTRLIDGAWYAVNPDTGEKITEKERYSKLKKGV